MKRARNPSRADLRPAAPPSAPGVSVILTQVAGRYAVCRLQASAPAPDLTAGGGFVSVTRTGEELSVICPEGRVPPGAVSDPGWACMRVTGTLDLSLVGILSSLAGALSQAAIPILAVSTYDTDYLLVKAERFAEACAALEAHGHCFAPPLPPRPASE